MFSQACVKNSVHRRECVAGGLAWQGACMAGACVAGETATAAVVLYHPTGMHSCSLYLLSRSIFSMLFVGMEKHILEKFIFQRGRCYVT